APQQRRSVRSGDLAVGTTALHNGPGRRRRSLSSLLPLLTCLLTCGLICGCTSLREYIHNGFKVGPNYGRPPVPTAPDWIDAADARVRKDADDLNQWWTVFSDPALNSLICFAYEQNLTVRQAGFQVLEA